MIDLLTLFFMLFCAGFQTAPSNFDCPDDNGNVINVTLSDQEKQDYYDWLNDAAYKDDGGIKEEFAGF